MKPPRIRFPREDYQELSGATLEKFLRNLTAVSDYVTRLGDRGVTLDNLRGFTKELTFAARDDWTIPALTNGWLASNAGYPVRWRWEPTGIRLRGLVDSGTLNTSALKLPAGPANDQVVNARCNAGTARVDLRTTGEVVIAAYSEYVGTPATWTSLDGLIAPVVGVPAPNPVFPLRFRNELGAIPAGVLLLDAMDETTGSPVPVSLGSPAWQTSKDDLLITHLSGVVPGRKYRATMLVLGG